MTTSFLKDIIKSIDNEYASIADDGLAAGDVSSFIDTGSYIFNALVSGSIYGGIPSNKITALAGESSTGKTFFTISVIKHFLKTHPEAGVAFFESEGAISKDLLSDRGVDTKRVVIIPVVTVQQFRQQALMVADNLLKDKNHPPMLFVLDSLGMLSTTKEIEDSEAGKETRDMTRAQVVKSIFRVLTLKLSKCNIPLIVTNHTYDVVGAYMPTKEMGGGSGLKYAASTIIFLSKSKEKDGKEVIGNIIKCETKKSRFTKESAKIATRLFYDERGLDPYYGLLELGEKYGVFERKGNRIVVGDSSVYPSAMLKDPEKYFTTEVMQALDECAKKEFAYGT
jgi:RecA/RadA recombinase|tara:strand:+ start:2546 stop:3559 length:1014 start_codon:yes stop_codon:yes gene_type:complete